MPSRYPIAGAPLASQSVSVVVNPNAPTFDGKTQPEQNPFPTLIPESIMDLSQPLHEYMQEQASMLRETYDKSLNKIVYRPVTDLNATYDTTKFPLGTQAEFFDESYGQLIAIFVQFVQMNSNYFGAPVGTYVDGESKYVVTNTLAQSQSTAVLGLLPQDYVPENRKYGWVIISGPNIQPCRVLDNDSNTMGAELGWHATGYLSASFVGSVIATQVVNEYRGENASYQAGELDIQRSSSIGTAQVAVVQSQITNLSLELDEANAAIETLGLLVASEDSALSQLITTVQASVGENTALITEERTSRIAGDTALAQSITILDVAVDSRISASATILTQALANTEAALAESVTNLTARFEAEAENTSEFIASATEQLLTQANKNSAVVTKTIALSASITLAEANITANASAITTLDARVTVNEGDITANATSITALDTRLTTAEGNITANSSAITTLDSRVTTAEGSIIANASSITALDTRLTAAEGNITANASAITSLDTRVTSAEGSITANASAITALDTRVTAAEGNITGNATAITALDTRVTTAEGTITANASSITVLNSSVGTLETQIDERSRIFVQSATPTADNVNDGWIDTGNGNILKIWNGTSWQTRQDSGIGANSTSITSLNTSVSSINGTLSSHTSQISTLQTDLTTAEGSISANATDITTIEGDVTLIEARRTIQVNAAGVVTGMEFISGSGGTSTILFQADKFIVTNSTGTGDSPFRIVGGVTYIQKAVIEDLSLETGKLENNAVSRHWSAKKSSTQTMTVNTSWQDVTGLSITATTASGAELIFEIGVNFEFTVRDDDRFEVDLRLVNDGTEVTDSLEEAFLGKGDIDIANEPQPWYGRGTSYIKTSGTGTSDVWKVQARLQSPRTGAYEAPDAWRAITGSIVMEQYEK